MAYTPFHADWKDFPDTSTPITEAALEHIETGIVTVDTKPLNQVTAPTGSVALNSQKITGLATPTAGTDAATKAYADSAGSAGVTDATITTTDVTTNNASTSKHGWQAKADNNRSHYYDGKGAQSALYGVSAREWFVDGLAAAGGDGHSPAGAFTTFAAAMAVVQARDIIYVLGDLQENMVIDVSLTAVVGVGYQRVLFATASTSLDNITVNITQKEVRFENFVLYGHSTFKGVHLALNRLSGDCCLRNISIDGTLADYAATYHSCSPMAGTGIGGIGILTHNCDIGFMERIRIVNCSIGIGGGTWTTRQTIENLRTLRCMQALVIGLYTGPPSGQILTSSLVYGGPNQEETGEWTIKNFTSTNTYNTDQLGRAPHIDLIGSGGSALNGGLATTELGGKNIFEKCRWTEGNDYNFVRIGTPHNTFINCYSESSTFIAVAGDHNLFLNCYTAGIVYLHSDKNTCENYQFRGSGIIQGNGSQNEFRNVAFPNVALSFSGSGNIFRHCTFGYTSMTRSMLGPGATVTYLKTAANLTYGATVATDISSGGPFRLLVTNNTPFTMSNPIDGSNFGNNANIVIGGDISYDIKNNTGSPIGAITWGAKFLVQGGATGLTSPAAGKRVRIDFYYNPTEDLWIESGRTGDI